MAARGSSEAAVDLHGCCWPHRGGGADVDGALALPLLITKRVNTLWIIGVAAALSFMGAVTGMAHVRKPDKPILVDRHEATQVSSAKRSQDMGNPSSRINEGRRAACRFDMNATAACSR